MSADSQPKVSIVIPAYRTASTLEAAVRSVLNQTLTAFEIIIVEDHSDDDTLAVANRMTSLDERVQVIGLPENKGPGNARNIGFERARGEWIAILDADDVYLPQRLSKLVAIGEAEKVDLVADNQNYVDGLAGVFVQTAFPVSDGGRHLTIWDFIKNNSTQAAFSFGVLKPMFRAAFLRKHGLYYHSSVRLAEDFYFLMEFFAANGRGYLTNQPFYVWTLPFGPVSRSWTTTGLGPWRYDYQGTIAVNDYFIQRMRDAGQVELVTLLQNRAKEYQIMLHYISAQKEYAQSGNLFKAAAMILAHPSTWRLLTKRVIGRIAQVVRIRASPYPTTTMAKPVVSA